MTKQKTARLIDACTWLSTIPTAVRARVLDAAKQAASGSQENPEGAFMREIAFQYDRAPTERKGEQSEWPDGEKTATSKVKL